MATDFSDLYSLIRSACNDHGVYKNNVLDTNSYIFRDDIIVGALKLILLDIDGYSAVDETVDPDIATDEDKKLIIFSTALALLVGETKDMFATKDSRFTKEAPQNQLLYVAGQLANCDNISKLAYAFDGSTAAIVNMGLRYADQMASIIEV